MQDFVFRDPGEHVEEIRAGFDEFSSLLALYADQPQDIDKRFLKLLFDLSHIIHHHDFARQFADLVLGFTETHPESIPAKVRLQFVHSIMLLHGRSVIDTAVAINKLIPLLRLNDKECRRCIYGHFINSLAFHQTNATKRELQKFVSPEHDARVAFKVLQLIVDLFHKENADDAKTINFIARCLAMTDARIVNVVVSFFLDPYISKPEADLNVEEERRKAELRLKVSVKTAAREKKLEKAKRLKIPVAADPVQVIGFLDDPNRFALRLFTLLSSPEDTKVFKARESQMRAMSLLSKVICSFQLDFDAFFNWATRFVRPSYDEVTRVLAIVANAVHETTSNDTLADLLRTIADRFVADHLDEEVMIVGMNAIREICARNAGGMTEDLAGDLVQYKRSPVKGIVVATRGIVKVLREVAPDLLPKRERGRPEKVQKSSDEESESDGGDAPSADGDGEVTEETLLEGSRVHKRTKEEKLAAAKEGKSPHKFRSRMEDKTAGFSDREKLKNKPFMLTRFRRGAGHVQKRNLNAIQKDKKRREGVQRAKFA
jgi:protein SDA1